MPAYWALKPHCDSAVSAVGRVLLHAHAPGRFAVADPSGPSSTYCRQNIHQGLDGMVLGRGIGVGRGLGVGVCLGVAVAVGLGVGAIVAVAVAVGVGV